MKSLSAILISILTLISGCNEKTPSTIGEKEFVQITISEANTTPTIDIKNFTLITNNVKADSSEAVEILKVKRNFPLAMQTKDSALFESILARNFTFRGENEFFNRNDYIHNRINGTWTIDTVKYQNLALQFFSGLGILTYRNILNGTDDSGKSDVEYYSWADIYIKENGDWKILGVHNIDARIEYINK